MIRTERRLPLRYLLCVTIPLIVLLSATRPVSAQSTGVEVGVDEKLGEFIPLDVVVTDADGKQFMLAEYIDRPTILALAYYRCPDICTPLMMGLTNVLQRLDLTAGEDFRVLTIGFDPRETTMDAMHSRDHMMGMFRSPLPDDTWRFTVTDSASIALLTDAVGFRYIRRGQDFDHPALLTVVTSEGKIARYLYGITFLPFDLKLAITEAAGGRVGATLNRILLFCFSYDPDGQTYVFNILKVTGTLFMLFAILFVAWLVISGKRSRSKDETPEADREEPATESEAAADTPESDNKDETTRAEGN